MEQDWKEMIKEGMKLIAQGCKKNTIWTGCVDCPFDEYCTAITTSELTPPDEWKELPE